MIEINAIRKTFGDLVAVDDLTLNLDAGQIFGFIGPNGAGKSTTMKILACLLKADAGTAKVAGMDTRTEGDRIRKIIGYMPDFLGVYHDLTVDEYLHFFAAAYGLPRKQRRSTIDGVLELTDLTSKRTAMVDSLSRGMQQRLGEARVLVHDPKVLLLDEPASGLDPRARIEMRELLTELGRMGKTLIVSSHILSELAEMSTVIGIIEKGKLLFSGSIDDAYARIGKGHRILVTVERNGATNFTAAASAIAADDRIASVTATDTGLDVTLAPGHTSHHTVVELVLKHNLRIEAFAPQAPRLEDAFITLTKGELQ
ncbi:MAG: ABC transporter ATP-binding protein [Planctomycetota bacterium]